MFPLDLVKLFLAENQAFGLPCISILSKSSSSSVCVWEHGRWEVAACPSLSLFFKIGSGFLYGSGEKSMFLPPFRQRLFTMCGSNREIKTGQWSSRCSCGQSGCQMPLQQRDGTVGFCQHREIAMLSKWVCHLLLLVFPATMTSSTVVSKLFCWELVPLSYMLFLKFCTAKAGTYARTATIHVPTGSTGWGWCSSFLVRSKPCNL